MVMHANLNQNLVRILYLLVCSNKNRSIWPTHECALEYGAYRNATPGWTIAVIKCDSGSYATPFAPLSKLSFESS